jgi:hypothetical protein
MDISSSSSESADIALRDTFAPQTDKALADNANKKIVIAKQRWSQMNQAYRARAIGKTHSNLAKECVLHRIRCNCASVVEPGEVIEDNYPSQVDPSPRS